MSHKKYIAYLTRMKYNCDRINWEAVRVKRRALNIAVLYAVLFAAAVFLSVLLSRGAVHFICPFRELTGLRCPGCGNSNALLAVARGGFREASGYNPMFYPEMLFAVAGVMCASAAYIKGSRPSIAFVRVLACGAVLILIWGIVRNIINV